MTTHHLSERTPTVLHRRLTAIASEGILGQTVDEVVIHLTRNALHYDWASRPAAPEVPQPPISWPAPADKLASRAPAIETRLPAGKRLLRLPQVSRMVGLARSSIYRLVGLGTCPAPKKLGAHSVAWLQSEVESWIDPTGQASGSNVFNACQEAPAPSDTRPKPGSLRYDLMSLMLAIRHQRGAIPPSQRCRSSPISAGGGNSRSVRCRSCSQTRPSPTAGSSGPTRTHFSLVPAP